MGGKDFRPVFFLSYDDFALQNLETSSMIYEIYETYL